MENNKAFVATLNEITPIQGADKIVSAGVFLNGIKQTQVIVGKDTVPGTLVAYFDSNLCFSDEFIQKNKAENYDRYLAKGNRVKTIRLKGVVSNGLVIPVEKFEQYFKNSKEAKETMIEGYSFNVLGKSDICKKYIPVIKIAQPQGAGKQNKRKPKLSRLIEGQFHFHIDTDQLLRNVHRINPDDVISISSKWHGTSSICAYVKVKKQFSIIEKFLKLIKVPIISWEYDHLYSSRNVVKNGLMNLGYYGTDIWTHAGEKYFKGKLVKGETVYFEICGFLPSGGYIQKMYDYGCKSGEYAIRVYRITMTNDDGSVTELGWQAMKERCIELGVKHVIEYYFGRAKDKYPHISTEQHWHANFLEELKKEYLEKKCSVCNNDVPDEGIVLRKEGLYIQSFKLKSESFILRESAQKESEDEVDIEDSQTTPGESNET